MKGAEDQVKRIKQEGMGTLSQASYRGESGI